MARARQTPALGFLFHLSDDINRPEIENSLEELGYFTEQIVRRRVRISEVDLALILDDQNIVYAAFVVPFPSGSTGKRGIRVSNALPLATPIDTLCQNLPSAEAELFRASVVQPAFRPPAPLWDRVWNTLKGLHPDLVRQFETLEKLRAESRFNFTGGEVDQVFCERDAVGVALHAAGIQHRAAFIGLSSGLAAGNSLVRSLSGNLTEEVTISYDATLFPVPGYVPAGRAPDVCQFRQGDRYLTVYYVNNRPGEHALGVDLIYHHVGWNAFTFVQYKMMGQEGGMWCIRPDDQLNGQVQDMIAARQNFTSSETLREPSDFRACRDPFFFKLCKRERLLMNAPRLTIGMYLPLSYWELLLSSDRTTGPQGGKLVTFERAARWHHRTEFCSLVARGWVGTTGLSEQRLRDYIESRLQRGHSVLIGQSESAAATGEEEPEEEPE